ncbi:MAG: RNA polymerase sigma factor [Deferribacteraceae bacterium]|jgi:RNA polymerase sigma factor (sigma-70 family)|nr:RNA polymerase sigma factor [Deferribacteraceae bacterium]
MPASDVFKEKSAELLRFIRRRVRSEEDAENILQDVFYQFHRVEILLSPIENVYAWLYRTARNKIIDLWRKKEEIPLSDFLDDNCADGKVLDKITSSSVLSFIADFYAPETEYIKGLFWERFEQALEKLPQKQREIFELTEFEGVSFKELAEQTGLPINTLLSRKHYAVVSLRKSLADIYRDLQEP